MRLSRVATILSILIVLCVAAVGINRWAIPTQNTAATHFDTLIVLGYPAKADGSPSPDERERVSEAVREYKAGVAPAIIMTGGSAHNHFVEAHVMAMLALSQGVPRPAVIEEREALNTIQNVFYSSEIMRERSWHTAEVISSSAHLGRAAMILQAFPNSHPGLAFDWRTHPAPWPAEYSFIRRAFTYSLEASRCLQIRIFGFPKSRFLPKG